MQRLLIVAIATLLIALGSWTLLARDAEGGDEIRREDNAPDLTTALAPRSLYSQQKRVVTTPHPAARPPVAAAVEAVSEQDLEPATEPESSIRFMNAEDEQFAKQEGGICESCVSDALAVQTMLYELCGETSHLKDIMQTEVFFSLIVAYRSMGGNAAVLNEEIAGNVNCENRAKWIKDAVRGVSIRLAVN